MNEDQIVDLLYTAFMCRWYADEIERGWENHPEVFQVKRYPLKRLWGDTGGERGAAVRVIGACAVGFAILAGCETDYVPLSILDFELENKVDERAILETCGGLSGRSALRAMCAADGVSRFAMRLNDVVGLDIPAVVARLRRRSVAIQRMLNMTAHWEKAQVAR